MKTRIWILSLLATVLLTGAGSASSAPVETELLVPEGGLVLDGGDLEEASLAEGSCLDPGLAGDPAPEARPSLAASADVRTAEDPQAARPRRPMAFEYSDGYRTRLKIHKYSSFAMLPLFVAQYVVGQKLYDGTGSDSTRSAHGALAATTAVLFGVNTVTGVWNMVEGRKDPNRGTKVKVHGILMLLADAGFVATGAMAPDRERGDFTYEGGGTSASTHRTVALVSMGVATAAYLMMLIH
jgi:hypothetical protein